MPILFRAKPLSFIEEEEEEEAEVEFEEGFGEAEAEAVELDLVEDEVTDAEETELAPPVVTVTVLGPGSDSLEEVFEVVSFDGECIQT